MKQKPEYYCDNVTEIGEDFVIVINKFKIEKGKTTTKGSYPKLNQDDKCKFPERASCDSGDFFVRCPFMKYDNTAGAFSSNR